MQLQSHCGKLRFKRWTRSTNNLCMPPSAQRTYPRFSSNPNSMCTSGVASSCMQLFTVVGNTRMNLLMGPIPASFHAVTGCCNTTCTSFCNHVCFAPLAFLLRYANVQSSQMVGVGIPRNLDDRHCLVHQRFGTVKCNV